MCGIVGYFKNKEQTDKAVLYKMMSKIMHRGPDGFGTYFDDHIALGHCRLSIIDLELGKQPMYNETETLICIFNGEIYNFQELKYELIHCGHTFTTNSDTEVLLHGYEEWKNDLPAKLRGMFAFAIWDKEEQTLFCARDYFGIKPFYYYKTENCFLFGSEIKSFLPHPNFEKKLNEAQLDLYLSYQYSPGAETFFQYVYKLLPAHYLIFKNGKLEIHRYWTPNFHADSSISLENWVQKIDTVMQNSVKSHKISDVEVGSFLSSGIDSSYIASLAHVSKTFTVGFENGKYNESSYANDFCQILGCSNTAYQITPEEFWQELPTVQYHMDEPLADASAVALYFLNREASRQVKVCLSGEGADELFGGYNIYKEPFQCKKYDALPLFLRHSVGKIASLFPPTRGLNFLVRHQTPLSTRYIGNTMIFTEKEKKKLCKGMGHSPTGMSFVHQLSQSYFNRLSECDDVTRMQYTDLHLWLSGDILLKADKMSMANSLELRVPFLDKEVFEVSRKIPTQYRVNEKTTKIALRKASLPHVGMDCSERKKWGFPVPVREWIRQEPYVTLVRKSFESPAANKFFHTKELFKLLEQHQKGKLDNWRKIWCIYMFLIWYEVYFDSVS